MVREHVEAGGLAAVVDGASVILLEGRKRLEVAKLEEIPLTLGGRARLNLDSILAATLALHSQGVDLDVIRRGLESFRPQPSVLPGRLNLIRVRDFEVLVDYAHNRVAFAGLKELLGQFRERKVAAVDAAGDRSDEEILELGRLAGQTYNEVVLYEDRDRRGREPGEIVALLRRGVLEAGLAPDLVSAYPTAEAAWAAALARGSLGTLVVILTERSEAAIAACSAAV